MTGKRLGRVFVLVLMILTASGLCTAQTTYDIAAYMPWRDGQWTVIQDYDPLDSSCGGCFLNKEELSGFAVSKSGLFTIHSYYNDEGQPGNWIQGVQFKYQRTSTYVKMSAFKTGGKWWSLKPVLRIPRSLELNKPFQYSGIAANGTNQLPMGLILVIGKAGFSVTTKAGSFRNCIQAQWIHSFGPEVASIETKVMAKGVGEVKIWHSSLGREKRGYIPEAFGADTEYREAIQRGVSNPPFP